MRKNNKVGPIGFYKSPMHVNHGINNNPDVLDLDHRLEDEYLQSRRAMLKSYHLITKKADGYSDLKQKIKTCFKDLCVAVQSGTNNISVGVRVYRFTINLKNGGVLVFRCFVPYLKMK